MGKNGKETVAATDAAKVKNSKPMKEIWSWPHYALLFFICSALRLKFNAHVVKTEAFKVQKKKGAMLVLCNHTSALDFGYFTAPFFFKKVSFVVAENMMYSVPIFATVIKGYHAITKKQYFADYSCIKNMKRYLDAGISVIICPEGKVSAEGKTGVMPDSIARLVKWLGYPVATVITKGAGLTRPKWAHTARKGKVVSYCDMLMTVDEIKATSQTDVFAKIEKALYHNEHVYQLETGLKFKGKRYAEGLERLLYRCPKCGAEFKMTAKEDVLTCGECGNTVRYPNTGGLVPVGEGSVCPERIDLWLDAERADVNEEVKNPDFSISKPVNLFLENETKNGYRFVTSGTLILNREKIEFLSTINERPKNVSSDYKIGDMAYNGGDGATEPVEEEFKKLVFPVKNFVTIANIPGSSLDIYDEKHTYRMMFSADLAATKYALAVEEMAKNAAI